ncbi:unnamed protein product [Linum trigynum]|uniref:Pentatricopeptide repeat-containing protein n=1 Tax=Linum trigynum TaxID=586398 RepID=A0AAV2FNB0_9ROSI
MVMEVFAVAGLENNVQFLLRDIVSYYRRVDLDVLGLSQSLLGSPELAGVLSSLWSVLIKFMAEKKLMENAVSVSVQAKENKVEPHKRDELFVDVFDQLRNSGPWPNVHTYTILLNFYRISEVDLVHALMEVLDEMQKFGLTPTAVTHMDEALKLLEEMRSAGISSDIYSYSILIHGVLPEG